MRARSREQTPYLPGLTNFWTLPRPLRHWPLLQRVVGGIETRLVDGHAELTLPTGDILCCGPSRRDRHIALKTYFYVGYLGQYVRRFAPEPGAVVLDLGANLGCFALPVARRVGPTGRVICVEPVPDNATHLRQAIAGNGLTNITVVEAAVGATEGTQRISLSRTSQGHSGVIDRGAEAVVVPLTTVDQLVASLGLPRVDFIKMDVEGMEADVLRGAVATLRQHRPRVVMSGYHRPEDAEVLPRVLHEVAPEYHCEGDEAPWSEFDFHAWCDDR